MLAITTNRFLLATGLCLSFTATLGAQQVQVTPVGGDLTVQLQPYQGSVIRNTVPVLAGISTVNIGREAIATSSVGILTTLRCEANGPPSSGHGGWSSAAGRLTVTYATPTPVAGILRLSMQPSCFMNPAYFDIGADRVYELIGSSGKRDISVVLGQKPLFVDFFNETVNFSPGICIGTSSIEFIPSPTKLQVVGTTCGPELTGSLLPRSSSTQELTCHASAVTRPLGVFVFGTRPSSWALPCPLFSNIDVAISAPAVLGEAEFKFMLPSQLTGTFLVQYIEIGVQPFSIGTSNALRLVLP